MENSVLKSYKFKLKDGVSDVDFLKIYAKVQTFLSSLPGFQFRTVCLTEDNYWIDVDYWDSQTVLTDAEKAFESNATAQQFIDMVDVATMEVNQGTVMLSTSSEAA